MSSSTRATDSESAAPARQFRIHTGVGFFVEKQLAACLDHDLTFLTQQDADDYTAKTKPAKKDEETEQFFPDGCVATMKDRKPLASCVEQAKNKSGENIGTHTQSFFRIETLNEDTAMRRCISDEGKWSAVSRDSPEYLDAQAAAQLKKDEAHLKELRKQLGQ